MSKINDTIFEKGKKLFKRRAYKSAIKKFNIVIEKVPYYEPAWRFKGKALYNLGKYEEASLSIDKALELNSSSADAWLTKMYLSLQFNKYEEALKSCNEALNIHPNKYWLQMAYVHEQFKHFKEALECTEKALDHNTNNLRAQRVKFALLNGIVFGKNYYIPVARSPLLDIIPTEDKIIYSTRLNMKWQVRFPRGDPDMGSGDAWMYGPIATAGVALGTGIVYALSGKREKGNLVMDAILTLKGIALYIPPIYGQDEDATGLQYLPWNQVTSTSDGKTTVKNVFNCELVQESKYESTASFNTRYSNFHKDIRNMRFNYTKECLEKAKSYLERELDEKALHYVEEGLKSNVFKPEYNLNSYFIAIKGSIRKKKEDTSRKVIDDYEHMIIDFLKANKGQAYTLQSLLKNLEDQITNSEIMEHFQKDIEGLLNRLVFSRFIQSTQREGKTFYFF
jgi:tetratricopeptide (TPR) repeat protein